MIGKIPTATAYFNDSIIKHYGIDPIIRGLASQEHQEMDIYVVKAIRDELFAGTLNLIDLISIDILRACDTGVPDYIDIEKYMFNSDITQFSDITSDPIIQAKFAQLYSNVENVDPLMGMFAEPHMEGSLLGKTMTKMISNAFYVWVEADSCFYTFITNKYYNLFKDAIEPVKLSHLVYENTEITPNDMQENAFYVSTS